MLGITYFPKKKEFFKIKTQWEKHVKNRNRTLDRLCSEQPLKSRKDLEEALLWRLHEKGATVPSWCKYKKTLKHTKVSELAKYIMKLEKKSQK